MSIQRGPYEAMLAEFGILSGHVPPYEPWPGLKSFQEELEWWSNLDEEETMPEDMGQGMISRNPNEERRVFHARVGEAAHQVEGRGIRVSARRPQVAEIRERLEISVKEAENLAERANVLANALLGPAADVSEKNGPDGRPSMGEFDGMLAQLDRLGARMNALRGSIVRLERECEMVETEVTTGYDPDRF